MPPHAKIILMAKLMAYACGQSLCYKGVVGWCWVNLQCWGVLLLRIIVGQGPIALVVGAGGGCLDIFSLVYHFSPLSPSLWETTRYRLKYCLKGPLNPKQLTNQFCYKHKSCIDPLTATQTKRSSGWTMRFGCLLFANTLSIYTCHSSLNRPVWSNVNPFKFNGFFHSYYLEKSILHFRGVRLVLFFISLTLNVFLSSKQ